MQNTPRIGLFKLGQGGPGPIMFLCVCACVMAGALVWMLSISEEKRLVPVVEFGDPDDLITIVDDVRPWDPATETWGPVDDATPAGRAVVPRKAIETAASRVALHGWGRFKISGDFTRMDARALLADSVELRGQPMEVVGEVVRTTLISVSEEHGFRLPGNRDIALAGVVRARASVHGVDIPVRFLLVDSSDEVTVYKNGGTPVKLQGVFFKLQDIDVDGKKETGIFMLAKRIYRNFRVPHGDEIDREWASRVTDPTKANHLVREVFEAPIFDAIGLARSEPDKLRESAISIRGNEITVLLNNPDKYRGKTLDFQGRVVKIEQYSMAKWFPQNIAGDNEFDTFWSAYVTTEGKIPLTVVFTDPPPEISAGSQVRINAISYRIWNYQIEDKRGRRYIQAPLLVGVGEIVELDSTGGTDTTTMVIGISVFCLIAGIILSLVLRADRNKTRLFEESRRAKRQVQRGAEDLNAVASAAATKQPSKRD